MDNIWKGKKKWKLYLSGRIRAKQYKICIQIWGFLKKFYFYLLINIHDCSRDRSLVIIFVN